MPNVPGSAKETPAEQKNKKWTCLFVSRICAASAHQYVNDSKAVTRQIRVITDKQLTPPSLLFSLAIARRPCEAGSARWNPACHTFDECDSSGRLQLRWEPVVRKKTPFSHNQVQDHQRRGNTWLRIITIV